MKIFEISLLFLVLAGCASNSQRAWFLSNDCEGADLSVTVRFEGSEIFQSRGAACSAYRDNRDSQWQKEILSADFEPDQEITWTGYREEPFDSPSNSILTIDLWLAGADVDQSIWFIGVTVRDPHTIYMNTIHLADLNAESETCIAPRLCVTTTVE